MRMPSQSRARFAGGDGRRRRRPYRIPGDAGTPRGTRLPPAAIPITLRRVNGWVIVLLILVAAGVIFLIVKAAQAYAERERQRKAGLAYWAAANGFIFTERDPWNFDARYRGVDNIGTGHDRYAFELVTRQDPVPCSIFRYHYKTWETRTVTRN